MRRRPQEHLRNTHTKSKWVFNIFKNNEVDTFSYKKTASQFLLLSQTPKNTLKTEIRQNPDEWEEFF